MKIYSHTNKNSKRVLSILLLFFFLYGFGQQIILQNENNYEIKINYNRSKIKLNAGEKKTIVDKEIDFLNIEYNNGKQINRYIPIFLNSNETLQIIFNPEIVGFKGDREALHDLIVNQQHHFLYTNVVKYQEIYYKKKNAKELINFTELVLSEYFKKLNH